MAINVDFTLLGEKQISRRIERFEHGLQDASPAFEEMHTDFLRIEKRQFQTQGLYGSGGWKPLSDEYVKKKQWMIDTRRIVGGKPAVDPRILGLTDRLRDSLINKQDSEHIGVIKKNYAKFGTKVPYGEVHQRPKATNKLPRRRPIDLTENNRRHWVRLLQKHIIAAMKSRG